MSKEKKMENAPVVSEQNLPVEHVAPQMQETLLASDLIIPRMVVLQGQSKRVSSGDGKVGDVVLTTTGKKLTDPKSGMIAIVPLTYKSTWVVEVKNGTKWAYVSHFERNATNETIPGEYTEEGKQYRRNRNFDIYALLLSDVIADIEAEQKGEVDIDSVVMPVLISFRRSSYYAGKSLVNFFQRVRSKQGRINIAPYHYVRNLGSMLDTKDDNTFAIFVTNETSQSLKALPFGEQVIGLAEMWYSQVAKGAVKIDDEETAVETHVVDSGERKDF